MLRTIIRAIDGREGLTMNAPSEQRRHTVEAYLEDSRTREEVKARVDFYLRPSGGSSGISVAVGTLEIWIENEHQKGGLCIRILPNKEAAPNDSAEHAFALADIIPI
jgi:hypothetical protein